MWITRLLLLLLLVSGSLQAETYTFDTTEFERKPLTVSGYLEGRYEHLKLNAASAFSRLADYAVAPRNSADRLTTLAKINAKYTVGDFSARAHVNLDYLSGTLDSAHNERFDEAAVMWKPDTQRTAELGKVALKWGKGYAWNPVGFVERVKDPNDPELAREGYWMATGDWIQSFDGPLSTVAFTPVIIPTGQDINSDFGRSGPTNLAAKLYLLYDNTDIDFMVLGSGSRAARYGFDFSRNITSSLEIHGEWAHTRNAEHRAIDASGVPNTYKQDVSSYLLGVRYLTERELTLIAEYYRNGPGYTRGEVQNYFDLIRNGDLQYQVSGIPNLMQRAQSAAAAGYNRPQAMQQYAYVRASQKEPGDILYFTPSVTAIVNLDDRSYSVFPELLYTGFNNVELRARLFFLGGGGYTDFGERSTGRRLELLARLYF